MALTARFGDSADERAGDDLKQLLQPLKEDATPLTTVQTIWIARALVAADKATAGAHRPMLETRCRRLIESQRGEEAAGDEIGGIALPGETLKTESAALAATLLNEASPLLSGALAQQATAARTLAVFFCYQQMIKPREAYFAAPGSDLVGAVRTCPDGAASDLSSAAAVLEALSHE